MRRRSSRSEVEVYFNVVEWPTEIEKWWGYLYPHKIITVGVSGH
jgi:hypothetical protein